MAESRWLADSTCQPCVSSDTYDQSEQSTLGTGEHSLVIDGLKTAGPVFDCGTAGLRGFLVRSQDRFARIDRVKLDPSLPSSVNSLFAANPHRISSIAMELLWWDVCESALQGLARLDFAPGQKVPAEKLLSPVWGHLYQSLCVTRMIEPTYVRRNRTRSPPPEKTISFLVDSDHSIGVGVSRHSYHHLCHLSR